MSQAALAPLRADLDCDFEHAAGVDFDTGLDYESNRRARGTWEVTAVGSQRASADKGTREYFQQMRDYRYGYETPWIPEMFRFDQLAGKSVLEIGVGNGIDATEMAWNGAHYTGIDITQNHLALTQQNFEQSGLETPYRLIEGDLLTTPFHEPFDTVYSFGVLHHISHEQRYLERIRQILRPDGTLMFAVYGKYSFFNAWMTATWFTRNRCRNSYNDWRSHVAELSPLGDPVTIKIRSRKEVEAGLSAAGFQVISYAKRGFVQNYLPGVGRMLKPNGWTLQALGSMLGWYHIFHCRPEE